MLDCPENSVCLRGAQCQCDKRDGYQGTASCSAAQPLSSCSVSFGAGSERRSGDASNAIVAQEFVEEHNAYRCEVGLEPIVWDCELATVAQQWADEQAQNANCAMAHSTNDWRNAAFAKVGYPDHPGASGWVGENLAWLSAWSDGSPQIKNGREISGMWASEKADFNLGPSSDSCTKIGDAVVGHYTQMVWYSTRKIGCGVSECDGASLFVCQYFPGGNMMGQLPFCKDNKPDGMGSCQDLASYADPSPCVAPAGSCGSDGSVCSTARGATTCGNIEGSDVTDCAATPGPPTADTTDVGQTGTDKANTGVQASNISASSEVALRFEFQLETDLNSGDSIVMTLPGFEGASFSTSPQRRAGESAQLSVSMDTANSVHYNLIDCPPNSGCQWQGTSLPCYESEAANLASPPVLYGEWRKHEETFSLRAKHHIPVGTRLTIDVSQHLRTPSYGLSANSPLITIESTRDARDLEWNEKKLAICANPEILSPAPKELLIDPATSAPTIFAEIPGDSKTTVTLPPSCFGASRCRCRCRCKAFDHTATSLSAGQKPAGPVLTLELDPPDTEALKPLTITLSVTRAKLLEVLALMKELAGRRKSRPALAHHYYDDDKGQWTAIRGGDMLDEDTATVTGEIPPDILNSPSFSGQLTV